MTRKEGNASVEIHIFGALRIYMDRQGLPYSIHKEIAQEGRKAYDIGVELGIPPEEIEGVFLNGQVRNLYDQVVPGDRIAFFPHGTPGPYRVFLGVVRENRERKRRENCGAEGS